MGLWTHLLLATSAAALSAKPPSILAIGETLYDSLPHGVFLGGAPLNVAVHAAQLGAHAAYASAVGDDALGRDAKRRLEGLNVDCELVQTRPGLETGFVSCVLDENGDATYDIAYPAAWDSVHAEPSLLTAARSFDCLVHGSLALRGEETASTLRKLAADATRRVFDINVRPLPDGIEVRDLVEPLLPGCYVVKMNEDELQLVQEWFDLKPATLEKSLLELNEVVGADHLVVTRAERGAALVDASGAYCESPGVVVDVVDTVGSGDSFTARLVYGLLSGESASDALGAATRLGSWVASQAGATPRHDSALG